MMQSFAPEEFFEQAVGRMFYVGFLKSAQAWFPLCMVSDPESIGKLDTLLVSSSFQLMNEALQDCAGLVSQIEDTFIQYLTTDEMKNLVGAYALDRLAMLEANIDHSAACGCGCNCS